MKKFTLFLAAAVLMAAAGTASAQITYVKSGTGAAGWMAPVFNAIDSLIVDGTIVSVDTTAASGTNLKRIVVRPYAGTAITRPRCIGVAVGPIQRSSRGGNGTILLWGYHPGAKIAASNVSANTMIKVGVVHGAFASSADSLSGQVGWFIGYAPHSTAAASRGKVFITAPLGRFFATL